MYLETLKNVGQPSCIARRNQYSGHFGGREIQACFIRRISVASNAIQTIDNEVNHLITYCLNCIRRD